MAKLRISIVEYLNTAPLVRGFTHGEQRGKYELRFEVPSACAESVREGRADIGIIPAVEYARLAGDFVVLPEMAVAAKRDVRSILVLAKTPIEQARRIALDTSSRSSQALVRILCKRHWKIAPEFAPAKPDVAAMLADADAALLIGDPALRVAIEVEDLQSRARCASSNGELQCAPAGAGGWPAPGVGTLFVYDVAHEWQQLTGLPCVLAIWVARREAATPEVVTDFLASKQFGLTRVNEIAAEASQTLRLDAAQLERYLNENIDFSLDAANRAGLELYFRYCAEDGLIPAAKPIAFATAAAHAGKAVE